MHARKVYFQNFAQNKKKLLKISILSISSPMHTKGKMIQRGNNYITWKYFQEQNEQKVVFRQKNKRVTSLKLLRRRLKNACLLVL